MDLVSQIDHHYYSISLFLLPLNLSEIRTEPIRRLLCENYIWLTFWHQAASKGNSVTRILTADTTGVVANISTACWNLSGVLLSFFPRHSLSIIIIWQVPATQYPGSLYKLSIIAKSQARSVAALWRVLSAPWVLSSAPSAFVTL